MATSDTTADNSSAYEPTISQSDRQIVDFQQLSKGSSIVYIVYGDQIYQLRKTRNGKLILHK